MSGVALGLSTSFVWPGSGGGSLASAGVSQFGNLRLAVAANSAITGGYPDGYLLLNQNHISLHHIGSTWTNLLGHSAMVDHGGGLGTAPFTGRWLTQTGTFSMISSVYGTSGITTVTFPTPYGTAPSFLQLSTDTTNGYILNVSSLSTGGFTFVYAGLRGAIVITGVTWESDGTV